MQMSWQQLIVSLPLFLSIPIASVLLWQLYRRRRFRDFPLMFLVVGAAIWAAAYGSELVLPTFEAKKVLLPVMYTGVVMIPLGWLLLGLHFNNQISVLRPWMVFALMVIPACTLVMVLTNESHHLFWTSKALVKSGPFVLMVSEYGPWFWMHLAWCYSVQVVGAILIVRSIMDSERFYARQRAALAIGLLLPWSANAAYVFRLYEPPIDFTPLAIILSAVLLSVSVFRYRLGDIVPVAREKVVNNMREAVLLFDEYERLIDANPAALEMFEITPASFGHQAREVLAHNETLIDLVHGERSGIDQVVRLADDRYVRVSSDVFEEGERYHLLVLQDLTLGERIQSALRLVLEETSGHTGDDFFRALTRGLATALDAKYAMVGTLDEAKRDYVNMRVMWQDGEFISEAGYDLRGTPCENVIGSGVCVVDSDVQRKYPLDASLVELGAESYIGAPLYGFNNEVIGLLVVLDTKAIESKDVAVSVMELFAIRAAAEIERGRAEYRRQHAQKLESLGVMAGGIAHDFNNLLMPIVGYLDLIEDRTKGDIVIGEYLAHMHDAATRLADLSNQMLTYSGKGQHFDSVLDVNVMLDRLRELLRASTPRNISILYDKSEGLPCIRADETQINQVVMNLVINAAEAMSESPGTIRIATGMRQVTQDQLESLQNGEAIAPGEYAYVEVIDHGCGIPAHAISRLFEPFYTTKFTGRGLGMAVVFGIVKAHRGAIGIESTVGSGSRVRVLFPITTELVTTITQPLEAGHGNARGSVLVVDDEHLVRATISRILTSAGYVVVEADTGKQGQKAFHAHREDLVGCVIDLTMPEMDGQELTRIIRRHDSQLPVVLVSGYAHAGDASLAEAGITFLKKPFESSQLLLGLQSD